MASFPTQNGMQGRRNLSPRMSSRQERRYNQFISKRYYECSDEKAANDVKRCYSRGVFHSLPKRILWNIITSDLPLDIDALDDIITATDHIFFNRALQGRVKWRWSGNLDVRFWSEVAGTAAFRCAAEGGYETQIILSEPLLKNTDRRLLILVFIHELIHCYLAIRCGQNAKYEGGHTAGFHRIAAIIDNWSGKGRLNLCNMRANLGNFRGKRQGFDEDAVNYVAFNTTQSHWDYNDGFTQIHTPAK